MGELLAYGDKVVGSPVADRPTEVTWLDWVAMTAEQKAGKHWLITDVPGAEGTVEINMFRVLWQNPNFTADFAAQSISLSDDDYDCLWVDCLYSKSNYMRIAPLFIPKGQSGHANVASSSTNGVADIWRNFSRSTDTSYSVSNCAIKDMTTSATNNNSLIIPYRVYGFKFNQTINFSALAESVSTRADHCMMSDEQTSVEDAITANDFKAGVDIKSYTSASPYEAPSDGYLYLGVAAGGSALAWVKGSTSSYVVAMGGQPGFWSTFVRKGMKLYGSGSPATLSFFGLQ